MYYSKHQSRYTSSLLFVVSRGAYRCCRGLNRGDNWLMEEEPPRQARVCLFACLPVQSPLLACRSRTRRQRRSKSVPSSSCERPVSGSTPPILVDALPTLGRMRVWRTCDSATDNSLRTSCEGTATRWACGYGMPPLKSRKKSWPGSGADWGLDSDVVGHDQCMNGPWTWMHTTLPCSSNMPSWR